MKKMMMTAACLMLGGMMTVAMAGDGECEGKKKKCGDKGEGEGECEKSSLTVHMDQFTVHCGEKKGKGECGGEDDSEG